jgi:hypothetical protein
MIFPPPAAPPPSSSPRALNALAPIELQCLISARPPQFPSRGYLASPSLPVSRVPPSSISLTVQRESFKRLWRQLDRDVSYFEPPLATLRHAALESEATPRGGAAGGEKSDSGGEREGKKGVK